MDSEANSRDIVVIGASAGGVDALCTLCAGLPPDFPAAVCIVLHLAPNARSMLDQLLGRAGHLPVAVPKDGERLRQGRIYVAAPDRHMLLRRGRILMRRGPHENRTRPAIDALFRSAALSYGPLVIGVVLTGLLDDGTEGLNLIKRAGGVSVVQDPEDAAWPSMPRHAIEGDHVDHVVPLARMAELLERLAREAPGEGAALPDMVAREDRMAEQEVAVMDEGERSLGRPSRLSCPQCGGVLNELKPVDAPPHFRCQIGHAFTPQGLAAAQEDKLEEALLVAIRTHRDRLKLFRRMEEDAGTRMPLAAARWHQAADDAEHYARILEDALSHYGRSLPEARSPAV